MGSTAQSGELGGGEESAVGVAVVVDHEVVDVAVAVAERVPVAERLLVVGDVAVRDSVAERLPEAVAVEVREAVRELDAVAVVVAEGEMPHEEVAEAVPVAVAVRDAVPVGTTRQDGSDARMKTPLLQAVPAAAGSTAVEAPFTHWTYDDEHGESGRRASYCDRRNVASAPTHTQ